MLRDIVYSRTVRRTAHRKNQEAGMAGPGKPIGFIAPTVEILQRAEQVALELGLGDEVAFRMGVNWEGMEEARRLEEQGAQVVISRRSTSVMIEENLAIPNVTIPVAVEDVAQAMHDARRVTGRERPRVAFCMHTSEQRDMESFTQFLGVDLRIYPLIPDETYLRQMVDRVIADKWDVIVGGTVVSRYASERNFHAVIIDSGPLALRTALLEAKQVSYARGLEKIKAEYFRIIVESSYSGIIVLDGQGRVELANPAAHTILGLEHIEQGTPAHDVLPGLDVSVCLNSGESRQGLFLGTARTPLVLDATSIVVASAAQGAVISFQPAETVTELAANTRKNLHSQGFGATYNFNSILGISPQIGEARSRGREFAESDGAVLLAGETGTGKELFAQAIHASSSRRHGPFVAINCAAIPSSLLESELFGHEEGAFTGAMRKGKPGMFELAHTGSIFLDEISEMNKQAQLRLLRVLQERKVIRLGGSRVIPVDFRIVAATNRNLWALVERGKFRKDLYYRLSMLPLFIPPLRQRQGDVLYLARYFLRHSLKGRDFEAALSPESMRRLEAHPWPGNVRELQNVMERYALHLRKNFAEQGDIAPFVSPHMEWTSLDASAPECDSREASEDALNEREKIALVLREHKGHRGRTAEALGINRSTLYHKLARYGIR